jgi:hypothetical protein
MVLDIIWCRLWCSYCHWIPELWIDNHWQIAKFSNSCLVFVSSLFTHKKAVGKLIFIFMKLCSIYSQVK